jgi:hypothetical protein
MGYCSDGNMLSQAAARIPAGRGGKACGNGLRRFALLPHSRFETTAGRGDEQSQTNPRGLTCLLSVRYAKNAENKPMDINRYVINSLQPFLARFRGKMNGLHLPIADWGPGRPELVAAQACGLL